MPSAVKLSIIHIIMYNIVKNVYALLSDMCMCCFLVFLVLLYYCASCWYKHISIRYPIHELFFFLKGTVRRKQMWVKSGINR